MGEIFKGLLDKAPDIIGKAAGSPFGVASLIVLVVGIVGVFLFRNAAGKLKLAAFPMITACLLGVIAFVFMLLAPDGTGGKGGDAKVGGNGVAVGGPGGHGGKYGHGGAGGSGEVKGDGVAAGAQVVQQETMVFGGTPCRSNTETVRARRRDAWL